MDPTTTTTPIPDPPFAPQSTPAPAPPPEESGAAREKTHHVFPIPKLRLKLHDLSAPGTHIFLTSIDPSTAMADAIDGVCRHLYLAPHAPHLEPPPPTRSVTLVLRAMDGVAYTTGSDLDADHKEIHFSTDYIQAIAPARRRPEILGVVWHELVHCFQHDAQGTCPGGLIEGVADWVRLRARLAPPHWKRVAEGAWDAGYDRTAYFLEYLETRFGDGTVRRLNARLRGAAYEEKRFWTEALGRPVEQLWADYAQALEEEKRRRREEEEMVIVERPAAEGGGGADAAPSGSGAGGESATPSVVAADEKTLETGAAAPPAGPAP